MKQKKIISRKHELVHKTKCRKKPLVTGMCLDKVTKIYVRTKVVNIYNENESCSQLKKKKKQEKLNNEDSGEF